MQSTSLQAEAGEARLGLAGASRTIRIAGFEAVAEGARARPGGCLSHHRQGRASGRRIDVRSQELPRVEALSGWRRRPVVGGRRWSARCSGLEKSIVREPRGLPASRESTAATPAPFVPIDVKVGVCCHAHTARLSSRAARRRRSWRRRSVPVAMRRSSMRSRVSAKNRSCCTTTSRRSASARPALSVRQNAAKSATASSPSRGVQAVMPDHG